jgi:large subunit ribosomal protein L23
MNINDIIIKPIITEKSSNDMAINKYTFEVSKKATKDDIKRAVETIFAKSEAKVKKINVVNVRAKKATMGRFRGTKSSYKKAIVTLSQGSIPIFGDQEVKDTSKDKKKKTIKVIDTDKLIKDAEEK